MTKRVGLIGARGYTGREMLALVHGHGELELAYASSREWAGKPIAEAAPDLDTDLAFEALGPDEAAQRNADVVILGLPNGKSDPFVDALLGGASEPVIIDLSADYRNAPDWAYGLPELRRSRIRGRKLIANPGCYATAAQLAMAPLAGLLDGCAHVFGVSGWSGAGTTPSRKNDPAALKDNIQPYALIGHGHEPEIARGVRRPVRFIPSVANYFRGLVVTVSACVKAGVSEADARAALADAYADAPFVAVQDDPAEPAVAANTPLCVIGGLGVDEDTQTLVVTAALDNLLKGAASQAMQNLNLALGFDETLGLLEDAPTPAPTLPHAVGGPEKVDAAPEPVIAEAGQAGH